MKILVCISKAPDTTSKIAFTDGGSKFDENGVQYIVNPYDEWYALVRALELKEAGGGNVTILSVGGADYEPIIRKALAIGADDAVRIDDPEALRTIYELLWQEGLYMGGSVGINVAAAVETARRLGPGNRIVTVLCDSGDRYRSRLYDRDWLTSKGLEMPRKPDPEPGQ